MQGHTGRLNSVRLGPDNMALTVSDDYTARAWDLKTGKCKHVFKGSPSSTFSYNPMAHKVCLVDPCKHLEGNEQP